MAPSVPEKGTFDPGLPPHKSHSHEDTHSTGDADDSSDCPFCRIAATYAPYDPSNPPTPRPNPSSPSTSPAADYQDPLDPERTSPDPSTFIVLSTPQLIGFLDIMPLSTGHVLLCPRKHRPLLTDSTPQESAELGRYLRVLSAAVGKATGVRDWNVVQNNGAAAAQVVPHMHFHIIPRPGLRDKGGERFTSTMFGRGQREELDDDEGKVLAERIRGCVADVLRLEFEGTSELNGKKAKL